MTAHGRELEVLRDAVGRAAEAILRIAKSGFETRDKGSPYPDDVDPVTTADLEADRILKTSLLDAFPEDGWLSEETADDPVRLERKRTWIVDPIDGTREFVAGMPEYAISVCLVDEGEPVLAAVCNPAANELYLGARGEGVTLNGRAVRADASPNDPLVVLASRTEVKRGDFDRFEGRVQVRPMGSIAYKLARVAAGQDEATWSLGPKHEWDVAGGVCLVLAAGGRAVDREERPFLFNRPKPLCSGVVGTSAAAYNPALSVIRRITSPNGKNSP